MTAAQPPPRAPAKQHLLAKYHVEVLAGEDSAAALPLTDAAAPTAGQAAAADAAAEQAAAAVEADEAMLEEPQEDKTMSKAKAAAAAELAKQGHQKAAVELWGQAINGDPANPVLYCKRGYSHMHLQKEAEAVRDFTICLDLPGCPAEQLFQAQLFRGMIKRDLGDLSAATVDLRAAYDAAPGPKDKEKAQAQRRVLVQLQVEQRKKEAERKEASKPVLHRYGTAVIEEIDGEDESSSAQEKLVHERVAAWEEVALKLASQARGSAARLTRALEVERKRIREENKARVERNAVREARRKEAAQRARQAVQQAERQAQLAAQQQAEAESQSQQPQVWVERTRIPIQTVEGCSTGGGSRSTSRLSESSRSTSSRLAGYESEPESESVTAPGAAAAATGGGAVEQAEQQQQAGQPAADERTAAPSVGAQAAEPAQQHPPAAAEAPLAGVEDKAPAAGSPVAVAAAEASQATAAADGEEKEVTWLESAEALTAAAEARQAAVASDEEPEQEAEGAPEAAAAAGEPAPAAAAAVGGEEAQQGVQLSEEERAAALLSEEQLDALKAEGDKLQKELKHEAAEERYARYLRLRPSDPRVWSNRAENCIKLKRWHEALEYCNSALAITSPSHPLAKYKLLVRRGRAYQGLGRLQEALGDFEASEAAAELEGNIQHKQDVAKRIGKLLQAMQARGIERAPRTTAELGLQAAAAGGPLELPSIPVVLPAPQHEVPAGLDVAEEEQEETPAASKLAQAAAAVAGTAAAGCEAAAPQAAAAAPQAAAPVAEAPVDGAGEPSGKVEGAAGGDSGLLADQKQAALDEKDKGNACFQRHQWRKALRHYDRAIELDPQNKQAMCNKAAVLLKLKEWQEALNAADQALQIDAKYLKARYRRAHAYAGLQIWNCALIDMEIVEEGHRAQGKPLEKEDQLFLAECRRRQDEAVAAGLCSAGFAI